MRGYAKRDGIATVQKIKMGFIKGCYLRLVYTVELASFGFNSAATHDLETGYIKIKNPALELICIRFIGLDTVVNTCKGYII